MITEADVEAWSDTERRLAFRWLMKRIQKPQRDGKRVGPLTRMKVGESIMFKGSTDYSNLSVSKSLARLRMGEPEAQWMTRMTTQGRRVTRTQ